MLLKPHLDLPRRTVSHSLTKGINMEIMRYGQQFLTVKVVTMSWWSFLCRKLLI